MLLLEEAGHATTRGAEAYAEVAGAGIARANGDEALSARVVQEALEEGAVEPDDIGVVVAGATSSVDEDLREARVLGKALGDRASGVPVSAPRSMTGHLLGASGAVDVAVAALILHTGVAPPTRNLDEPDPESALDHVSGEPRPVAADAAVVDGPGLDGQHAAIVLRRVEPGPSGQ